MPSVTVESLAKIIGSDGEALLSQMKEAGLSHKDVKDEVGRVPYNVTKGKGGSCVIHIDDKEYTPQEISHKLLCLQTKIPLEDGHLVFNYGSVSFEK